MSKVIVPKFDSFTVMTNHHLRDKELSLKAKGLMSFMLSLPKDWDYSIDGLTKCSSDGKDSIRSAIAELTDNGYLTVTQSRDEKGIFGGAVYTLHPCNQTENPSSENPISDNPTQINTNEKQITNGINKKNTKKADSDWLEFEEVWEMYPKHEGKQNAMKAYIKARKEGISKETIVAGIKAYVESIRAKGTSMQYVKMGSTWFNQRCWQDDYSTVGYGKSARDYTGQYASDKDQEAIQF